MDRRELDLRPDRPGDGRWDRPRQQRFIDTILRGWCVPAVHIGEAGPAEPEVVLDGGQRLHTIAQFLRDELTGPGRAAGSATCPSRSDGGYGGSGSPS